MKTMYELYLGVSILPGKKAGGYAFVLVSSQGQPVKERAYGRPCNSAYRLELEALWSGARTLTDYSSGILVHPCGNTVAHMLQYGWLEKWYKKGWNGRANTDILRCLYQYQDSLHLANTTPDAALVSHCAALAQEAAQKHWENCYRLVPTCRQDGKLL